MPVDEITRILIELSQDTAANKQLLETIKDQNEEFSHRLTSLETYKITEEGKDRGGKDILARITAIAGVAGSLISAYFYATKGGGHL